VKQVLSSLVLVSKKGGEVMDLRLASQQGNSRAWQLPGSVEYRFQNTGNVHVIPRGVSEVKDPLGRLVLRSSINEESAVILPESFRKYYSQLLPIATAWMPGRYQIVTTYRYDGTDQTKRLVTTFWYAGLLVVWLAVIGALVAVGGLVWWLWFRPKKRRKRGHKNGA
jgi:hypothetical protein